MSTMAAKITDPLKPTAKYQKAQQKVNSITDRKKQIIAKQGRAAYNQKLANAKHDKRSIKNKFADKRANVVEFDTRWMLDKVKEILSADNPVNQAWDLLHQQEQSTTNLMTGVNQMAETIANNQQLLQQDAMRMSLLLGAPLPEKAADKVLVGDQRYEIDPKDRGRRSLRIDTQPSLEF